MVMTIRVETHNQQIQTTLKANERGEGTRKVEASEGGKERTPLGRTTNILTRENERRQAKRLGRESEALTAPSTGLP